MIEDRTSLRNGIWMLRISITWLIRFFQFMLWHIRYGRESALAKKAYRQLIEETVKRHSQIEVRDSEGNLVQAARSSSVWGAVYLDLDNDDKEKIQNGMYRYICIPKSNVDRFLLENGFKNLKNIYQWWRGSLYIAVKIGNDGKRKILFDARIGDAKHVACIEVVMW